MTEERATSSRSRNCLRQLFPQSCTLRDFLDIATGNKLNDLLFRGKYDSLIDEVWILPREGDCSGMWADKLRPTQNVHDVSIPQIINLAVAQMVRQSTSHSTQNVLSYGYRQKTMNSEDASVRNWLNLECRFVNTVHSLFITSAWRHLAAAIGTDCFRQLLDYAMFQTSINGSYMQLCGPPANTLATKGSVLANNKSKDESKLSRFQIFYNTSSFRSILGPAHSLFKKTDDALCQEIFGVASESGSTASKAQDNSLQALSPLLKQVCARLRENILLCNGAATLRFCLQEEITRPQQQQQQQQQQQVPAVSDRKQRRRDKSSPSTANPLHKHFSSDTEETDSSDAQSTTSDLESLSESSTLSRADDVQPPTRKRTRRKSRGGHHAKRARVLAQPKVESPVKPPRAEVSTATPTIWRQKLPTVSYFEYLSTAIGKNVEHDHKHSSLQTQDSCSALLTGSTEKDKMQTQTQTQAPQIDSHTKVTSAKKNRKSKWRKKWRKVLMKKSQFEVNLTQGDEITAEYVVTACEEHSIALRQTMASDRGQNHHINRLYRPTVHTALSPSTKPKPSIRSKPILSSDANKETVEYAVSKTVVANYVKTLLRRWLPWKDIWGSRHNHHRIMRHIDSFIHIGRHESITVAQVMQGIRTADIPWLKNGVTRAIQQKCALRFVTWLFNRVIAVILAQTFYVTEAEGHGTEIFYFQKHIWRHIVHRHLHEFADRFVAIDPFATGATDDDTLAGQTTSSTAFELQRSVSAPSTTTSSSSSNVAARVVRVQSDHPPGATTTATARAVPPATTKKTSTLFNAAIRTAAKTVAPSSTAPTTTRPSMASSSSATVSSGKPPPHQDQQRAESNTAYQNQRVCQLQSWSLKVAESSLLARSMTVGQWQEHQRLQKAWLMTKAKQFSTIRFVPKKKALRGITNLRTKPGTTPFLPKFPIPNHNTNAHGTTSSNAINAPLVVTNTMLYNCLHVLKHLYDSDQRLRGFGVFGMDDVYREYRSYWNRLADIYGANAVRNGEIPLYMAALDLEKCFDNIDPIRLYDLIHDLLVGNATTTTTLTAVSASFPASPEALKTFQGRAGSSSSASSSHAAGFPSNSNFSSKFSDAIAIGPGGSNGSDRKGETSSSAGRLKHPVLIHKYAVTHAMRSMERVVTKHLKCCALSGDTIPFEDAGPEIARQYRNCVVADAVMYSKVTAQEILRILRHHLFAQVVRMPSPLLDPQRQSPYCMQVKGIPQGSILSPVLCHLYFGHVENTLFETSPDESKRPSLGWWKLAEPSKAVPQTMVMRLMDDYLIISTQQSCVEHFLQTAFDGYGEYGGKINPVKTKVNFSTLLRVAGGTETIELTPPWMATTASATATATATAAASTTTEARARQNHAMDQEMHDSLESLATQAQRAHSATMFTWCGLRVDTSTMELRPDLQRLLSRSLASSISIEANHPGMAFRRAIKSFFRMKCHALVLDTDMNSETTVLDSVVNLYQLTAARSLAYYQRLHRTYRVLLTPVYVLRCIREGILFAARLIPTRMRRKIIRKVTLEGLTVPDLDDHDADEHEDEDNDDDGSAAMESDAGIYDGFGRDASRRSSPVTAATDVMVTHFGNCSISVKMAIYLGWRSFRDVAKATYFHLHGPSNTNKTKTPMNRWHQHQNFVACCNENVARMQSLLSVDEQTLLREKGLLSS